jgi:cell division protein FtsI/penicillin-binding protein 2
VSKRRTRSSESGRFVFLLISFSALLLVIAGRVVWVQVIQAPAYSAKATSQRMRDIELPARRGTILDREGEPLAKSVAAKTVYAAPNTIKDKAGAAAALASVLGGKASDYNAKLAKDTGFVYIARKIDMTQAKTLEGMKLEGIGFLDDSKRVYPSGPLACQILGFVGDESNGLAGIEKRYNDVLGGKPGSLVGERDPYGRPIPGGVQKNIEPVDGNNIVLTIDKDIQYHAQVELEAAVKKWGATGGSVVVMNPRDGEIYAMASTPTFDPNDFKHADATAFRNRPISDAYEPGSTIKSLTAASVIDKGVYTPDSKFHLTPTLTIAGRTIHDAEDRGTVDWTLTQIVTNSSNVGAVKLGMKLGKQGLYDYFDKFGLTEATGVDYPGEARGWLPPTSLWSPSSIANIPFGQGLSATPLQLARAVSAIANDGTLVTPHFLMQVPADPSFKVTWPERRAISAEAAQTTTNILKHVVTEGTGKSAAIPGYSVAGKTGTAQVALGNGLGYANGRYIASFIGYLPADDPQLLIEVKIDEPSNGIFGGMVAAPVFATLAQFSVDHLKILPSSGASIITTASPSPAKPATKPKKPKSKSSGSAAKTTATPAEARPADGAEGGKTP